MQVRIPSWAQISVKATFLRLLFLCLYQLFKYFFQLLFDWYKLVYKTRCITIKNPFVICSLMNRLITKSSKPFTPNKLASKGKWDVFCKVVSYQSAVVSNKQLEAYKEKETFYHLFVLLTILYTPFTKGKTDVFKFIYKKWKTTESCMSICNRGLAHAPVFAIELNNMIGHILQCR